MYSEYIKRGCRLILLEANGKRPVTHDWSNDKTAYDELDIELWDGNLGWAIGSEYAVIDVDPRNGGAEGYAKLAKDFALEHLEPSVLTAGGGAHYYLRLPSGYAGQKFSRKLNGYEGVDFLTKGAYVVIAGSKVNSKEYRLNKFNAGELAVELAEFAVKRTSSNTSELGDFEGLITNDNNFTETQITDILSHIDPDIEHDQWVSVGMALHNWNTVSGLSKWIEWSKKGSKFKEGVCEKKWASFKSTGGISIGTLVHMDREAKLNEVNSLLQKIQNSNLQDIQLKLAKDVAKFDMGAIDRERVAQAIRARIKSLEGTQIGIGAIRDLISPKKLEYMNNETPKWCEEWLYASHFSMFINRCSHTMIKSDAFNMVNGVNVPESESGRKQSASSFVADNGYLQIVHAPIYLPQVKADIVEYQGLSYFNSFDPKSVPTPATEYTEDGKRAVAIFKRHVKLLCNGNDFHAELLIKWMAHNVQYKGKKLLWSPVIQSIQGVGKSYLGKVLRACLGDKNVGTVNSEQVKSPFNSWATDVCVNVLEELRVQGHNRYEMVNALKPLITDDWIQINAKGIKQFAAPNTCNYICFTNFTDALPIDSNDRRWFVIFTDLESLDELEGRTGLDKFEYFQELFSTVNEHADQLAKFLAEYEIDESFKALKQAPATEYKQMMVDCDNTIEGLSEIRELISNDSVPYVHRKIISSNHLFEALEEECPELILNNVDKNRILRRLGFIKSNLRKKIGGRKCQIWSTVPVTDELMKELVKAPS